MSSGDFIRDTEGDLAFVHNGIADGTPVVFLHGFSDMAECWVPFMRRLALPLPVYAVDAPGHGYSAVRSTPDPLTQLVDRGIAFLRSLGRPAILMGHSMGAVQAMYIAGDAPDLVRAVVLEDPPVSSNAPQWDSEAAAANLGAGVRATKARDTADVIAAMRAAQPHWDADEFEAMARSKVLMDLTFMDGFRVHREPMDVTLARITCDALLLTGDHERGAIIHAETVEWARRLCPTLRVAHFPGTSHQVHRDAADAVTAEVRDFILERA